MNKKIIVLILLIVLCPSLTEARIDRICKVSYETESGWSSDYQMDVVFVTGVELNQATRTFNFPMFKNYALLWFADNEVAILEINEILFRAGTDFTSNDFRNLFFLQNSINCMQVNSDYERKWRIKAKDFILFIDPRER